MKTVRKTGTAAFLSWSLFHTPHLAKLYRAYYNKLGDSQLAQNRIRPEKQGEMEFDRRLSGTEAAVTGLDERRDVLEVKLSPPEHAVTDEQASQAFVFWGHLKEVFIAPKMTIRYFEVKNDRNSFISSPISDLV